MKKWYLIYYKPRQYKNIIKHLEQLNISFYMPMCAVLAPRADSLTSHRRYEVPYFPGYVFVHFDVDEIHSSVVTKIPSAIDFVRTGNDIKNVPEEVIIGLKLAPVILDEINIINSPPVIYCENCSYDVLYSVINGFNNLKKLQSNDERVVWLLNIVTEIINKPRKQHIVSWHINKKRTEKWLKTIIRRKTCQTEA